MSLHNTGSTNRNTGGARKAECLQQCREVIREDRSFVPTVVVLEGNMNERPLHKLSVA